jgi:hypothetical protein
LASCGIGRPLLCNRRTASALNSFEYGAIFDIDQHPSRPARWHSRQMSTKPGEFQFASETSCEHGNRFLDRATLVPTLARSILAYFPVG